MRRSTPPCSCAPLHHVPSSEQADALREAVASAATRAASCTSPSRCAEGEYFELVSMVEDEREVREGAARGRCATPARGYWIGRRRSSTTSKMQIAGLDSAPDAGRERRPRRAAAFDSAGDLAAGLATLGEPLRWKASDASCSRCAPTYCGSRSGRSLRAGEAADCRGRDPRIVLGLPADGARVRADLLGLRRPRRSPMTPARGRAARRSRPRPARPPSAANPLQRVDQLELRRGRNLRPAGQPRAVGAGSPLRYLPVSRPDASGKNGTKPSPAARTPAAPRPRRRGQAGCTGSGLRRSVSNPCSRATASASSSCAALKLEAPIARTLPALTSSSSV